MEKSISVSEKDKLKQPLNSLDIFKILGSFLLVLGITLSILNRNNEERKLALARTNAKMYADELVANSVKTTHVKTLRELATAEGKATQEGYLGADPWGKPYSYKVIHNSYGQPVYMIVISAGPNAVMDTVLNDISFEARKNAQIQIMGDDVGHLKSYR